MKKQPEIPQSESGVSIPRSESAEVLEQGQCEPYGFDVPVVQTVERARELITNIIRVVDDEPYPETIEEALSQLLEEEALVIQKNVAGSTDSDVAQVLREGINLLLARIFGVDIEKGIHEFIDKAKADAQALTESGKAIDAVALLTAIIVGKKYQHFFQNHPDILESLMEVRDRCKAEFKKQQ